MARGGPLKHLLSFSGSTIEVQLAILHLYRFELYEYCSKLLCGFAIRRAVLATLRLFSLTRISLFST